MFNRIFPKQIDNNYRGHWLAIWALLLVVVLKAIQGVESIVNTREVATTADGISLDGLGAVGDGAHAPHEHVVIRKLPERAALLAGLLATL